jgi:O-acetyl-ADP-ribose deacetylase (regulator of RNase III)
VLFACTLKRSSEFRIVAFPAFFAEAGGVPLTSVAAFICGAHTTVQQGTAVRVPV